MSITLNVLNLDNDKDVSAFDNNSLKDKSKSSDHNKIDILNDADDLTPEEELEML